MSQFDTDYEDEQDEDDDNDRSVTLKRSDIRKLEQAAKRGNRATALEREIALLKAGVNTESAVGKMFAKAYDGDLTVEAIKAAAGEIPGALNGSVAPPPAAPVTEVNPDADELSATAERSALANGAAPDDGKDHNVRQSAFERSQEALRRGASEEDALGGFFNSLATAAAEGSKDVLVK